MNQAKDLLISLHDYLQKYSPQKIITNILFKCKTKHDGGIAIYCSVDTQS